MVDQVNTGILTKEQMAAGEKASKDKVLADQVHGAKILGDMEAAIRERLLKLADELGGAFHKMHTVYIDMPDELQEHTMYKALGERISSVEALLNTLVHTADSFPAPVDAKIPPGGIGVNPQLSK